jgi:hypothetical protein
MGMYLARQWLAEVLIGCLGIALIAATAQPTQVKCNKSEAQHAVNALSVPANPSFYVSRDGIQLLIPERLKDGKSLSPEAIRLILLSLEPEDWPEGCTVSVAEPGARSGNDNNLIDQNLKVLKGVLDSLGIKVREMTSA